MTRIRDKDNPEMLHTPAPQPQEWIISDKDYHIALEYFHLEARPAPSPNLHTCVHKEIRNGVEFCHYHDSPTDPITIAAQARNATLDVVQKILREECAQIDDNDQFYIWLEDAECAVESLRIEVHK